MINLWPLGGAIGRVAPEATAWQHRDAQYLLSLDTTWVDPADTERCIAWTRQDLGGRGGVGSGRDVPQLRRAWGRRRTPSCAAATAELRPVGGPEAGVRPGQPVPHEQQHRPGRHCRRRRLRRAGWSGPTRFCNTLIEPRRSLRSYPGRASRRQALIPRSARSSPRSAVVPGAVCE